MPDRPEIPEELRAIAEYFGHTKSPEHTPPIADVVTISRNGNQSAYVNAARSAELAELASCPPGNRNHTLNVVALKLARLPIDREQLRNDLIHACQTNGLIRDDGRRSVDATIDSAFAKADLDGPRPIPESHPAANVVEMNSKTLSTGEGRDLHQLAVARRAYELRVNDEARALWTRQRAATAGQQPPPLVNLVDLLAQPDDNAIYRIDDLLPVGGRVLLAAQYKAGKTSMVANLLRSLVDGDPFLGRLHVEPVSRIVLIDTELDERMLRRWLRDQGIRNQQAVDILCLRGRLATFAVTDDTIRATWAAIISGADMVILDCLRPCLDALGLSEDKDAGIFLTAFDALCREAGASEATVVHHMGHGQERSRGDSRLLDWPDVLWKIVRDNDDDNDNGARFFSALGRDVNLPESQLDWCPQTRSLTLCNGGRAEKRARETAVDIIEIMSDPANFEGLSQNRLVGKLKALGNSRDSSRRAVRLAVEDGLLLTVSGPGNNTLLHVLNPSRRS